MPRNFSFKFPDELAEQVEQEADQKKITISDVIRMACQEHYKREESLQNVETLLFEVVKSRSVMLQCLGKELTQQMVQEAEEDADAYLQERKQR